MTTRTHTSAAPFLKWAGGKKQLLRQIAAHLPPGLHDGTITRYAEPFIGGGAVFFHIAARFRLEHVYLSDMNPELALVYRVVQQAVEPLIEQLCALERAYLPLDDAGRRTFYYDMRRRFNQERRRVDFGRFTPDWITRSAQLIFLNRTCFNGLFRVNRRGSFNVPFGRYPRPTIARVATLRAAAAHLQHADIHSGDFTGCARFVDARTFVYFDPPYRPISRTAHFNSYARQPFDDAEQLRLAAFYRQLDATGAALMLSNSDPHNVDPDDRFFEDAYAGYHIRRLHARRAINSDPARRGAITELLILNYPA